MTDFAEADLTKRGVCRSVIEVFRALGQSAGRPPTAKEGLLRL